jgi:spore maturation protein CgeB
LIFIKESASIYLLPLEVIVYLVVLVVLAICLDKYIKSTTKENRISIIVDFTVGIVAPALDVMVWMNLIHIDFWKWAWTWCMTVGAKIST